MHDHAHGHGRTKDRRALAIALGLIVVLMGGEVAAGLAAGSLALLADAAHLLTDAAALAATALAGGLVLATGWSRFDPIAGLLVAALMVRSSWFLLRESGRIFLEAAPPEIEPDAVARALADDEDVVE